MARWWEKPGGVAGCLAAVGVVCALLLTLPGQTVVSVYMNDLMIFLDGAHRITQGQVPNRDFHTALGPLVYYLPAAGLALTGRLGAAMPVALALQTLLIAGLASLILSRRVRPVLAIPFGIFLILIAAVPLNLGESITALSFAMFYNRVGWTALALLLVLYLAPRTPLQRQGLWDGACAALLTLFLLYSKISYGAVAVGFLAFLLLHPGHRRWAAGALGAVVLAGLLIEATWRGTVAHMADLVLANRVSGGLRGGYVDLVNGFLRNLADYVLFGLLAGLALLRTRSFRDVLFYGFCAGAGLVIMIQNSQAWGILTLHAGALVAAETVLRGHERIAWERPWRLAAGTPLYLLGLLLPTMVHCTAALMLHAALATPRPVERFALPRFEGIRPVALHPVHDHGFSMRYGASLEDGARALLAVDPKPGRVFVLDFASPFSAGLGLTPPRGDYSWQHWGRNLDAASHVAPEEVLRDVRVVMEPKWGVNPGPLTDLYRSAMAGSFSLARESEDWRVWLRRDEATPGALSAVTP